MATHWRAALVPQNTIDALQKTQAGWGSLHLDRLAYGNDSMEENDLLKRITINPETFGGKPIFRGQRLAVEHVLGVLAAGDSQETLLTGYLWLGREDILACLAYAHRLVEHKRIEPFILETA